MEFTINVSKKDYISFNFYFLYSGLRGVLIFSTVILLLLIDSWIIYDIIISKSMLFSPVRIVAFTITLFYMILPFTVYQQASRIYKTDVYLREPQLYKFFDNSITISSPASSVTITPDKVFKIIENKKYILLYIAANKAFIIPKIQIQEQLNQFKDFIRNIVAKDRIKLRNS